MSPEVKIKAKPPGLDEPRVSRIIKAMSRFNVAIYKATGGLLGSTWRVGAAFPRGVPVLLLTTIGRKSGLPRVVPLLYMQDGEDVIVVASKGGLAKDPLWYRNLQAQPECEVQQRRRTSARRARTASPAERATLWPKLVALYADFASYQSWTAREIPVVILEPR